MLRINGTRSLILFFTSILIVIITAYLLAFRHTLQAYQINKSLTSRLNVAGGLSYQPDYLIRKSINLKNIISRYEADTSDFKNSIINRISFIAQKENVKVTGVPSGDIPTTDKRLLMEKLQLEGRFFSLLKVYQQIEQSEGAGLICSANWKKPIITNSGNGKGLVLELYIIAIKINK